MDIQCESCQKNFIADEMPHRGAVCFSCHVRSVRLGFTYGKDDFHGPTVRERQQKQLQDEELIEIAKNKNMFEWQAIQDAIYYSKRLKAVEDK